MPLTLWGHPINISAVLGVGGGCSFSNRSADEVLYSDMNTDRGLQSVIVLSVAGSGSSNSYLLRHVTAT